MLKTVKANCLRRKKNLQNLQVPGKLVNTVGKTVSEVNRAYMAGLIDADGAIIASIEGHTEKKFKFRVRVIIKVTQKGQDILTWLKETTQFGSVVQNRTVFDWIVRDQRTALVFLEMIQPFIKGKTNQVELALRILSTSIKTYEDLLIVAQLADTLASFNVRSKNRRKNYVSKIQETVSRND